jgi:hypothetical protein
MTGTRRIGVIVALIVALTPLSAWAQLGFALYGEYATITVGGLEETVVGPNIGVGENITASVPGGSASIGFDTPTTPDWMTATASIGTSSTSVSAQAHGSIDFKFMLNTLSNPPVSISTVPISVTASGHVGASSSGYTVNVDARAELHIGDAANSLVFLYAFALQPGEVSEDAFSETVEFQVTPTEIVSVFMWAQVTINAYSEGELHLEGQGNAYIDPVFTVSDELIPGTSIRYNEVYEIQFSAGWDDSTGGVPISTSESIGRMKSRFGN